MKKSLFLSNIIFSFLRCTLVLSYTFSHVSKVFLPFFSFDFLFSFTPFISLSFFLSPPFFQDGRVMNHGEVWKFLSLDEKSPGNMVTQAVCFSFFLFLFCSLFFLKNNCLFASSFGSHSLFSLSFP